MLPYTAVDLITSMDRAYGFEDIPADPTRCSRDQTVRRSRQILLAAAITLTALARR